MTKDAPAFDFYPERWTHGTRHMTKLERCDYLDLLCHQWTDDGLPSNIDIMARLIGYKRASQIPALVMEKFPVAADGKRRNARLEVERVKQRERIAKRRDGANKTNAKRWNSDSLSDRSATTERHNLEVASESPPPTTHHPPHIPSRKSSKPEVPSDPRHHEIMTRWCEAFKTCRGSQYQVHGGKDGKHLKSLLSQFKTLSANLFMRVAVDAWEHGQNQYSKHCKRSYSLADFCIAWNSIKEELEARPDDDELELSGEERAQNLLIPRGPKKDPLIG